MITWELITILQNIYMNGVGYVINHISPSNMCLTIPLDDILIQAIPSSVTPPSKLKKICFRAQCHLSHDTLITIVLRKLTEIFKFVS